MINIVIDGAHRKQRQEQRQPDQNLIGRSLLSPKRRPDKRQDDDDSRKRSRHDQDQRNDRQQRHDDERIDDLAR